MAVYSATSHPQGVMKEGLSYSRTPSRCLPQSSYVRSRYRRLVRSKRMVEAANPTEYEYIEGSIPMEWDAWIRGRRKEPPSVEELVKNESYRTQIKLKAKEVEEKDLALQAKEYEEGLVATPARTLAEGHASATSFGKQEISEEPTSTANTFQPGSWMPTSKK
ncbi:NADH dehydrogenase [ubiquinone] 1 alpha subcomplex assembly factor 2 isoform X3 [Platichthys flesus]|uniref:NADH dehydrogenase [ubiquinone] 1 alpha subcomplex assembly factor 2 isoform X3 n=1 Tax=Platichthys flesus TaxID=8260 RepID=UPI002DBEB4D0|nr:NADH dehydrogenase [ubiquinone] 1 alpha subcomplex assembly factor 2 isoform X3 [Platichthys flesus]